MYNEYISRAPRPLVKLLDTHPALIDELAESSLLTPEAASALIQALASPEARTILLNLLKENPTRKNNDWEL